MLRCGIRNVWIRQRRRVDVIRRAIRLSRRSQRSHLFHQRRDLFTQRLDARFEAINSFPIHLHCGVKVVVLDTGHVR
jgi:hypothetical protein